MIEKKITKIEAADLFPPLQSKMNKGDAGRVLVVCGSYDSCGLSMCGAAYFAAKAAYLCGAGIVEIFTPRENYSPLASLVPEAVFSLYGYEENHADIFVRLAASITKSDTVVLGCGLGKSEMAKGLVKATFESVNCPLMIDADGLNILSENQELWSLLSQEQKRKTVITPHPGEMARLTGKSIGDIVSSVPETAMEYAREQGIVCLLKDHNTAISDGETLYINHSGNPGMATAGMGDVLAGVIGALLSKGERCGELTDKGAFLRRVAIGAFLHGTAGDIAAAKTGQYSLTSSEILVEIPHAIADFFS